MDSRSHLTPFIPWSASAKISCRSFLHQIQTSQMNIIQFLSLHETIHFASSAIIAILLWKVYRNKWVVVTSIIAGMLIDADHLFDYILGYLTLIGPVLDLDKVAALGDYFKASGKVYVPLHSLDFMWIWWFFGQKLNHFFRATGIEWAIIISFTMHILVDYASYMPHPLAYFFLFRLSHSFNRDSFNSP